MTPTPAQSLILPLLAEGLTNKQIARRLNLSPATIKVQLQLLYKRIGVANRVAAAVHFSREP